MKELKEVLYPPFTHDGHGMVYDSRNHILDVPGYALEGMDDNDKHLAHVRGWGYFQYLEQGDKLQDEFMDFVTAAINEKWQRDFGS
jgi:hypothetical protein